MKSTNSYREICHDLEYAFRYRYPDSGRLHVRMVGILFAPAKSQLVAQEILPRINDFHHMSGNNIDFFCCGYGAYWPENPDIEVVAEIGEDTPGGRKIVKWQYSSSIFTKIVKEFKELTTWEYSGEVDLILANAYWDDKKDTAWVDFSSAIVLRLHEMCQDGMIRSVATLFQKIFDFTEEQSGEDATWGFSNSEGRELLWEALEGVVLKLLPDAARRLWRKGKHFAVINAAR